VCDDAARALSNDARTAVVDYLTANVGSSDQVSDKLSGIAITQPMHPSHDRAFNILEPLFVAVTASDEGQGFLGENAEHWEKVLELVPDEGTLHETLRDAWGGASSAEQRWRQLKSLVSQSHGLLAQERGSGTWRRRDAMAKCVAGIVFYFLYPRLDANVSKQQNHLLKSPFCVHPKTGRVCVPVDPRTADTFDPFAVPTIPTLMNDAAEFDAAAEGGSDGVLGGEEWGKTSLKPYLDYFSTWLLPMEAKTKQVLRKKAAQSAAALGEW
jgi:DNA primase small subunit